MGEMKVKLKGPLKGSLKTVRKKEPNNDWNRAILEIVGGPF